MRTTTLTIAVILMGFATGAFAGNPTYNADAEDFWNGKGFVLVAKVVRVQRLDPEDVAYHLTLDSKFTVAGLFNPVAHPTLTAKMSLGYDRWTVPKVGDLVLVVLFDHDKLNVPGTAYGVPGGRCPFMPDNQPIVILSGLSDERIEEVQGAMIAARAASTTRSSAIDKTTSRSEQGTE